jgi:Carbohydrate family 9 binding domain-like
MQSNDLVEALRIPDDIAVGDFDHPVWKQSKPVQIAHYWSGKPAPPTRHAEARLLWSNVALYARFVCPQAEPFVVSSAPQTKVKTLELWDRDVCEIFLAPNPSAPNHYFEFEAAPTGEWVDLEIQKNGEQRETNFGFDSGMSAAASITPNLVLVMLRIPWSESLPLPKSGERWRINLFRCVGSDPDRGYITWRPTYTSEPGFHAPEAFGWLLFSE